MVVEKDVIQNLPDWIRPIDDPKDAYKIVRFFLANEDRAYTAADLEEQTTVISYANTEAQVLKDLVVLGILSERMNHYMLDDRERGEKYVDLIDEYGAVLFDTTPNDNFPERDEERAFTGGQPWKEE